MMACFRKFDYSHFGNKFTATGSKMVMVGDVVCFHKYRVKISTFKDPGSLYFLRHINTHGIL